MPAEAVFIDTVGLISLLNASDSLHYAATELWQQFADQARSLVLTDWIIAETGNGLARPPLRSSFSDTIALLLASPRVRLVMVNDDLLQRALDFYASRRDKDWGLVDCLSFLVMMDQQIAKAFTNDHHFEQAGFVNLLPST